MKALLASIAFCVAFTNLAVASDSLFVTLDDGSARAYSLADIRELTFPQAPDAVGGDKANLATLFRLMGNYPNPFNPSTTIKFDLDRPGKVEVTIHDVAGRLVKALVSREMSVGTHLLFWDGADDKGGKAPAGVYMARIATGDQVQSQKLTLLK